MADPASDIPTKKPVAELTRRRVLQSAGGFLAAAALPANSVTASSGPRNSGSTKVPNSIADLTGHLSRYMVGAGKRSLPQKTVREAKLRVLDTLGAMVSGAHLKPGEMAINYVRRQGGVPEASVLTTDIMTSAVNAALANGMLAHSDETDDFEPVTKAHPGSSTVPAALAMAERHGRSGIEMLRAVALGYDVACRLLLALGPDLVRAAHRSAEGVGATFGSAAAAASLAYLDETGMRYALSYAAQQVSGLWSWSRDADHIEKAFDFGGMGARNGVSAAMMVEAGFTGVKDVLEGEDNLLNAFSTQPNPELLVSDLGSRYFIEETAIKTFPVGYPIQAALDAFLKLRREHNLNVNAVDHIVVRLPEDGARIVDNSPMPDVNCQYVIAVALLDGGVSFAKSHSRQHMQDPLVRAAMQRVELVADPNLMDSAAPRSAFVELTLHDGRSVNHFTRFAPGTKENPVDTETLNAKVRDLMAPVLGPERTEAVIRRVNTLENLSDVRELRPFLTLKSN